MPKAKLPDKDFQWTPELAYAVGLITTDGSLSIDGRDIDFTSKEKVLVELFRKCLHLSNKIGRKARRSRAKKKYYRIQFGNVVFYRWLQRIGLTPNKTKTVGIVKIPDKYFPDFLRGHLDGDSSIWSYIDRWNTFKNPKYIYSRLWTRFCSASKIHIFWLRKKVIELLGIKGHIWERKPKRSDQNSQRMGIKVCKEGLN